MVKIYNRNKYSYIYVIQLSVGKFFKIKIGALKIIGFKKVRGKLGMI